MFPIWDQESKRHCQLEFGPRFKFSKKEDLIKSNSCRKAFVIEDMNCPMLVDKDSPAVFASQMMQHQEYEF